MKIVLPEFALWKKDASLKNYYTFHIHLWNQSLLIAVLLANDSESLDQHYDKLIKDELIAHLSWIAANETIIRESVSTKEMLALADSWASSSEPVDNNSNKFIMEDGEVVTCPINKETFKKSLYLDNIAFTFKKSYELTSATLYFTNTPDYFVGHQIEIFLSEEHELSAGSLVG